MVSLRFRGIPSRRRSSFPSIKEHPHGHSAIDDPNIHPQGSQRWGEIVSRNARDENRAFGIEVALEGISRA